MITRPVLPQIALYSISRLGLGLGLELKTMYVTNINVWIILGLSMGVLDITWRGRGGEETVVEEREVTVHLFCLHTDGYA